MRKWLAAAVGALLLAGGSAVIPVHASGSAALTRPVVDPYLKVSLAKAKAADQLVVKVHAEHVATSRRAAALKGLSVITAFDQVGVTVARGTAAQINGLSAVRGLTYLEADRALEFHLDTAHLATRMTEARATYKTAAGAPYDGTGTTIAVIDSGIDGTHPMFQQGGRSKVVRNLKLACAALVACSGDAETGDATDPLYVDLTGTTNDSDTISGGGHGTHVAGIAAGVQVTTADGRTLSGAAPGAKLVGVSVGAGLAGYSLDSGLNWVLEHHAKPCVDAAGAAYSDPVTCPAIRVVNASLGPTGGGEFNSASTTVKLQRKLVAAGIVVSYSAGNGDDTNDGGNGSDLRTSPYAQDPTPGVLMVANYDDGDNGTREGQLDSSSSRGQYGRLGTYPDLAAPGVDIMSACRPYLTICTALGGYVGVVDPNYGTISGTSMASPYVAGVVASMLQAKPSMTPAAVEAALENTAHRFPFGGPYEADPRNSGSPTSFDKGHGLVDAKRAIAMALAKPAADAAAQCKAGALAVKDPAGDAGVVTPTYGFQGDPQLDIVEGRFAFDGTTMTFATKVKDLLATDPMPSNGMWIEFDFVYRGADYTARATRSVATATSAYSLRNVDGAVATGLAGSFDPATDTVTVLVPVSAFPAAVPRPVTGDVFSGFAAASWRQSGSGALGADSAKGYCPSFKVGTGPGSAPPTAAADLPVLPTPEGTVSSASPHYGWSGTVTTTDPAAMVLGCSSADDPACDNHKIRVNLPAGGGTITVHVTSAEAGSDIDLFVWDPGGNLVDSSGSEGSDETVTAVVEESGVYTVSVNPYTADNTPYTGTLDLS
jgi:serine protease AprX